MKTAVLITGKLDYFEETFQNIKERLLNPLGDYDVFVSTWDLSEDVKTSFTSLYQPKVFHTEVLDSNTKYLFEEHSKYQKSLEMEPKFGSPNSLYMWYKIRKGLTIIDQYSQFNETKYDLIVRLRTDFFFTNRITQKHLDLALNHTVILGPHCIDKSYLGFSHASDNFIMFPWDYIHIFRNLELYYSSYWDKGFASPENLLYETLSQQNINFTNSDLKLGRIHDESCILWSPGGTTYKGYLPNYILNLNQDFSIDNNSNLIL
jgi:hypothetical protein